MAQATKAQAVPNMRSAFLTEIKQALGTKPGVQVAEDRLVIANDGLFARGSSTLSPAGRNAVNQIAAGLKEVPAHRAPDTDWLVRVDAYADNGVANLEDNERAERRQRYGNRHADSLI